MQMPQSDHRASTDHRVRTPLPQCAPVLHCTKPTSECHQDVTTASRAAMPPCPDPEPASCLWSPPDAASAAAAGSGTPPKTTRRLHSLTYRRLQNRPLVPPPAPLFPVLDPRPSLTPVPGSPRRLRERRRPQLRLHRNPALGRPPNSAVRRRLSLVSRRRRGRRAPLRRRRLHPTCRRRRPPGSPPSSAGNAPEYARRASHAAGRGVPVNRSAKSECSSGTIQPSNHI